MPNEIDVNNNGGAGGDGGDAAAVAAKAAADKAAADAAAAAGGETVTIKKSDLAKIETDRDNYKAGISVKDEEIKRLKGNKGGEGQGGGGGQGGGNTAQLDETKVGEVATEAARKIAREGSERTAKRQFLKAHPEYAEDANWQGLVANLSFKGTEITHDEVLDRMEAALLEHKRSSGKLDEHLNTIREQGRADGRNDGIIDVARSAGGAGDRGGGGGNAATLTPKGQEMAKAMHVKPEEAAKIDPRKDNVIDVM